MTIRTTQPATIVHGKDSISTRQNRAVLILERSKDPVVLTTISDTFRNEITINAKSSFAYYTNIFFNYGVGMLLERKSPKRYGYPLSVYLNPADTLTRIYKPCFPATKGDLYFHVSFPYVNSFYFRPAGESVKQNTGFLGIAAGIDYYYRNNRFVSLYAGAIIDFIAPFPAPFDFEGEQEFMNALYLSLANNHKIKRFSLGYGLSYGVNTWDLRIGRMSDTLVSLREPIHRSSRSFGLVFSSYYQLGKRFNIGLIYRPTCLRINTSPHFEYEHTISFDMAWKIRMK